MKMMKTTAFYSYSLAAIFFIAAFTGCNKEGTTLSQEQFLWTAAGGNATVAYDEQEPFMKISSMVEEDEITSISQGRELFIASWLPAPNARATLDGLGPLFNANACTSCHVSDGRIAPYKEDGSLDQSFLFRLGTEDGMQHPFYGEQLQTQSTVGVPEGEILWSLDDTNSSKIKFTLVSDESMDGYNIGPRIAPHLVGVGLLDLVKEETILEYEDPDDLDQDGISGRAHWVFEENEYRIGKFGWKAINSTLRTQNAAAMHQDMGLTSPVHPYESCTELQEICSSEANGGAPEVSETSLMAIVNFMTALGVPQRRITDQEAFNEGSRLFESVGCASCHRPTMRTSASDKFKSLSNQTIYPYTDLLLHDMGEGLSDGVKEKDATAQEWRTPPLWSIGIVERKEGARFLHDGRAKTILEAIEAHGGEAQNAKNNFSQLSTKETDKLLQFLRAI